MNWTERKCYSCGNLFLISHDELRVFGSGECSKCQDPVVRKLRHRAVYGFYEIESINAEIANKIVEKDLVMLNRKKYSNYK